MLRLQAQFTAGLNMLFSMIREKQHVIRSNLLNSFSSQRQGQLFNDKEKPIEIKRYRKGQNDKVHLKHQAHHSINV